MNYWDRLKLDHTDLPPHVVLTLDLRKGFEGNIQVNQNLRAFALEHNVDVLKSDWHYIALTWAAYHHKDIRTGRRAGRPTLGFDVAAHFIEVQRSVRFDNQVKDFAINQGLLKPRYSPQQARWRFRACIRAAVQHPKIGIVEREHSNNKKDYLADFMFHHSIETAAKAMWKIKGKKPTWRDIAAYLVAMDVEPNDPIQALLTDSLNDDTIAAKQKRLSRYFARYPDQLKDEVRFKR